VGTPAPVQRPPEESPDYHGTIDLAKYCQQIGYSRFDDTDPFHLMCIGSGETGIPVDPLQICRQQHPGEHITIDRLADYFDPTSWQCYANAGRLGPIATVQEVDSFCKFAGNLGIFNNQRSTAYDWKCLHSGGILGHYTISMPSFPVGLSVTDMCSYIYGAHIGQKSLVMDRLTDYHNPGGWECWQLSV
jgi:hypothetical protein